MNIVSSLFFLTALMSHAADAGPGHMLDSPENGTTGSVASASNIDSQRQRRGMLDEKER
jgi:hypothetical protein